ncbi:hypothetical protein A6R68_05359 [Neotoma lepida]|uniref:Uncharacterized protein n=1 Tax=Neotoma lepida TaxID=56216 RepID=A0A1A6GIQ9_NEOLE|nr:hypothetical protein A6R68_05359 [Neotoma lepida]
MKLNISFPATGCQTLIEVDHECKLCAFYEKKPLNQEGKRPSTKVPKIRLVSCYSVYPVIQTLTYKTQRKR